MGTFLEETANAVRNAYCGMVGSYANFLEQNFPAFGLTPNPGLGAAKFAQRLFCNREPPAQPLPPFIGGQCAGVDYQVSISGVVNGQNVGDPNFDTTRVWRGPLRRLGIFQNTLPPPAAPGQWQVFGQVEDATGATFTYFSICCSATPFNIQTVNARARRADGLPDTCGDPPPIVPPPAANYNVIPVTIVYQPNIGANVSISGQVTFAPVVVGVLGVVYAPFRITIPTDVQLTLNGTINLTTGDLDFNFGDQLNLPPLLDPTRDHPVLPPEVPPVPPDVPNPLPPPPEEELERVIRGVIVTVTDPGQITTRVFQDGNPDIYVPRLGNVQFQVAIDGNIAWTEEFAVKNRRQLILCPWQGGARAVEGTPQPGVTWTLTPVFAYSNENIDFAPFS